MRKIQDRITLGMVSGLIAGIPGRAINNAAYARGRRARRYNPLAAALFLPKRKMHSKGANLVGLATNSINTAGLGVLITYILSATGTDMALVKGMGVGALSWVMVEGLMGAQLLRLKPRKPLATLESFVNHIVLGGMSAALIVKLGDERLFPPRRPLAGRIPLVYMGRRTECRILPSAQVQGSAQGR